jgi:glycosidase
VNNTHFDGLMDYPLRTALLGVLNQKQTVSTLANKAEELLKIYPDENTRSMMLLVGSHDTERIMTLCQNDIRKVKLAHLFLLTYPGAPCIYYGDEIGMEGGKDPDNRRAFSWDPNQWKLDLKAFLQRLINYRKHLPALRRGKFQRVLVDDQRACYAYGRILGSENVLSVMNFGNTRRNLRLSVHSLGWDDGRIVHNLLGDGEYIISGTDLPISIEPLNGILLA